MQTFKSKPDGYTIGWTHFVPFLSDIYLRGKKPTIASSKVAIIYRIAASQFYMFVANRPPYKSLADLKNAGKPIKFASTGSGAITWVQAYALGATVGFPVKFVLGYKKLTNAAIAVAKGDADAGIGGAVADAVGLRLAGLCRGDSGVQVLAVTHQPQVAARADRKSVV